MASAVLGHRQAVSAVPQHRLMACAVLLHHQGWQTVSAVLRRHLEASAVLLYHQTASAVLRRHLVASAVLLQLTAWRPALYGCTTRRPALYCCISRRPALYGCTTRLHHQTTSAVLLFDNDSQPQLICRFVPEPSAVALVGQISRPRGAAFVVRSSRTCVSDKMFYVQQPITELS